MKLFLMITIAAVMTGCAGIPYIPIGQQQQDSDPLAFMQPYMHHQQQQAQQPKQTDYACFNHCISSGLSYGYCESRCSY